MDTSKEYILMCEKAKEIQKWNNIPYDAHMITKPVINGYKRIWLVQRLVKNEEETIPDYLEKKKKYKKLYFNKFVWVRVYLYIKLV